jgi:IS5 family transposase
MQSGLFDLDFRLQKIDANGDPLAVLNDAIDWEIFRPIVEAARKKSDPKGPGGRPPYDAILMFKILILQTLYNLSDDATEYQILDRLSFMRFLGLRHGDPVPDAKTIWLFRDQLTRAEAIDNLFDRFEKQLCDLGLDAKCGQIVDASIVSAPVQRNTREENAEIKADRTPEAWEKNPAKLRQKDTDACWTKKRNVAYFGYKNHVNVDVKHKLIRRWEATDAAVHDSVMFEEMTVKSGKKDRVYADSAYRSAEAEKELAKMGLRGCVQKKGHRNAPLSAADKKRNRRLAKTRARVEHVFGIMRKTMKDTVVRGVGWKRCRLRIGLRNLTYNIQRCAMLTGGAA